MKLDNVVKTYLAIRDERDKIAREHQAKDRELANDLAEIENLLLSSCNDINAESIKTDLGTIIKTTRESFVCGDWDNFKKFVKENDAIELLQQRIHQSNFKEFLNNREDEGLPPGISSMREFKITVRKPSKT